MAKGFKDLATVEGSFSDLLVKHNAEIKALEKMPNKKVANDQLIDIVTTFLDETTRPAVINKIETEILPKMKAQNFVKNLEYLYSGIYLKGSGLSMGKLYDRNRVY
jgi:hypothetical protein